ncbi:helix-turn-helix domain-containing protein [Candidatus Omnitrophota bacterium]
MPIPDFFTINEVCKYLRIPKSTIYKLSMSKRIPCFKVGRQLRFKKASIDRWISKQEKVAS